MDPFDVRREELIAQQLLDHATREREAAARPPRPAPPMPSAQQLRAERDTQPTGSCG